MCLTEYFYDSYCNEYFYYSLLYALASVACSVCSTVSPPCNRSSIWHISWPSVCLFPFLLTFQSH